MSVNDDKKHNEIDSIEIYAYVMWKEGDSWSYVTNQVLIKFIYIQKIHIKQNNNCSLTNTEVQNSALIILKILLILKWFGLYLWKY